jgi:NADPH-dependent 2,4-dienoyl-CoA reductase/sulfur reductase-like enzyme/rhodanese-related sulfurtransferase
MKYLIIGAVAGGASTAARLRRLDEQAEIILIEKGEYISYANCGLPYYIGDVIKERNKLFVQTANSFNERFNISVRPNTEALSIDREKKEVTLFNLVKGEKYQETYDKLVLSPGAVAIVPPFPGINLPGIFTVRNVSDTDLIKSAVQKESLTHATVIGAGFIGLEMVENLHHLGIDVTLIERAEQVLPPVDFPVAALAQKELMNRGVELLLSTSVTGFERTVNGKLKVNVDASDPIETDLVILSIGVKPNAKLALDANLETGKFGGIVVNSHLQTSDPDIYAVGDVIEFKSPFTDLNTPTYLAGPANKQGRICANNLVFGNTSEYKGSINTAIVKLFDFTFATAGLSERILKQNNIPFITSTNFGASNAGYYPGAEPMVIQISFSPTDGTILGAQVAGIKGVDKRIDILSLLIQQKGSVYDLTEFEHAYAPPFSSAKDPLNMAGFAAENLMNDLNKIYYWNQIDEIKTDKLFLDVRTAAEFSNGTIGDALNFPLETIRERINELPKDKKLAIFCKTGVRSYIAQRILKQNGFDVTNLSGGYDLWKICQEGMVKTAKDVSEIK